MRDLGIYNNHETCFEKKNSREREYQMPKKEEALPELFCHVIRLMMIAKL